MGETESQKAIREAIAEDQERRRKSKIVRSFEVTEAPGDDCPGCHGNPGSGPCGLCQI